MWIDLYFCLWAFFYMFLTHFPVKLFCACMHVHTSIYMVSVHVCVHVCTRMHVHMEARGCYWVSSWISLSINLHSFGLDLTEVLREWRKDRHTYRKVGFGWTLHSGGGAPGEAQKLGVCLKHLTGRGKFLVYRQRREQVWLISVEGFL